MAGWTESPAVKAGIDMPVTGSPRQHTREAARSAAPQPHAAAPSWGAVLATTIRLWWQRRLRDLRRPWRALLALICVLVVAAVVAAVVTLTGTSTRTAGKPAPARRAAAATSASAATWAPVTAQSHPAGAGPGAGTATVPAQAAAWAATQLAGGQAIACDPAVCTALANHGVARGRLRPLRSAASAPAASVVAAAPAAGARLGQAAPVLLASFGTGASQIQVRTTYPGGAAAYQRALRSDLAARRSAGAQLLHSKRIQAAAPGTAQLRAGQVDSRVLVMLALLASQSSWRVAAFGGASPGAPATTAPLRQVVLVSTGGRDGAAAALALVRGQHGAYQAAQVSSIRLAGGQTGLAIGFAAPSPLGLLAGASG
jgi:hypothetical protein